MKIVIEDPSIAKLETITWGCADFWQTIRDEHLEDKLNRAIEEFYPDGISLGKLNDLIRYDDSFLEDVRAF